MKEKIYFMYFQQIDNALGKKFNNDMKQLNLTRSQSDIIRYLDDNSDKKIFQKDIEKALKLKNPTVTGTLNRMEEKGFVIREIDDENKRNKIIKLTKKAHEAIEEIKLRVIETEEIMSKDLNNDEKKLLNKYLGQVLKNIEEKNKGE